MYRDGPATSRAAAFFDLDKTVVAKSSALAFSRELYREGFISPGTVLKTSYAQLSFQLFGANADRMDRSRDAVTSLMRGWDATKVRRLIAETLEEVIDPLVYEEALDLLAQHQAAGHEVFIVSSAGEEIVEPLAAHLGVANTIATRMGVDAQNCYDGTIAFYCYGGEKAVAVRSVAEQRGLDLDASYAYSDSVTDLPMLEAVGHPVAVNPDRDLRATALERGWEIRDFRRPVALRSRLPRPSTEVVAGAGALSALAVAGWWLFQRRSSRSVALDRLPFDRLPLERLVEARTALSRLTEEWLDKLAASRRRS